LYWRQFIPLAVVANTTGNKVKNKYFYYSYKDTKKHKYRA